MTASRAPDARDILPPMAAKKTESVPTTRSGAKWTDADYEAAGWSRPTIRILTSDLKKLDALAAKESDSRSGMISKLIQRAWSERKQT
jgi:hypothetical protein